MKQTILLTLICAIVWAGSMTHASRNNVSHNEEENRRTQITDIHESYVYPETKVFTVLYATSQDGVVNVRTKPNTRGRIVGEIHAMYHGIGDGILLKEGNWHKVIASNGKVGYANSKILGKITWYDGGRRAIVAKADCPVYGENFKDGVIEANPPICKLAKGTIIAERYEEDERYYQLTSAHDYLFIPKRYCKVKELY